MKSYASQFDVNQHLSQPPRVWKVDEQTQPDMEAIFYEGAPYRGRQSRCFAWVGFPKGASSRKKVPGIVLVHGGGGTAFADWVRIWNDRGYAAIAMDTCGAMPCWSNSPRFHPSWPRHPYAGAPGWGGFDQIDEPQTDQWMYQASAVVLRATALLKSYPQVDAQNVGIAGVSWGGYLTLVVNAAAPADTYRFAIPVYASADFTRFATSCLIARPQITKKQAERWTQLWDPKRALRQIKTPMLFLTDAEDYAFAPPTWQETTEAVSGPVQRSMRIEYIHDHDSSMKSITELEFATAVLQGKKLPQWGTPVVKERKFSCPLVLPKGREIYECALCITRSEGFWVDRKWHKLSAVYEKGVIKADGLYGITAAFFWIRDTKGAQWSSPLLYDLKETNDFWPQRG